jgi:hypothetical protein
MRPVLFLAAFLIALMPLPATAEHSNPPPRELTAEQWREDLRVMVAEMKARHPNLYHQVSEAKFDTAVADLDRRIPQLQRNQVVVGMMRIAAMVGDGHTRVDPRKDKAFGFGSLPLKLYWFDDGVYIRAAKPEYRELVGARIDAIGGVPIAEAIRRASEIVSKETVSSERLMVPLYLAMPDILQALGLSNSRDSATLTLILGGKRRTVRVPVGEVAALWPADTDVSLVTPEGWVDARTGPQPLWLQAPLDYHRLTPLSDRKALYAQLNMVTDTKDESLRAYGQRILDQVRSSNPGAVILDLRLAQGGNGDLRNGLIANLIRAEDSDTRLFVLVARGTFSASEFILDDLDRLTDAVFIGEPASSRPTGYGDAYRSTMPNSGIAVRTSIKYWQSGQDMRPYVPIDIAAPLTLADYAAGRDPALEAALAYQPQPTLGEQLVAAAGSGGPEAALKTAQAYVSDPAHRYSDVERKLVVAEQEALRAKQGAAALAVSRWAAGRFPRNGDLATVWAFVAKAEGQKDEALKAIDAALAIDPSNRSAQSLKEEMEKK